MKKEDKIGIDQMKSISDEMKDTLKQFAAIQSAPKKIVRDKEGFITSIESGLNS